MIQTETRKAGPYLTNGVTVAFDFAFKVFETTDVVVTKTLLSDGSDIVLTEDTNYTITLNADQNVSPGGTITTVLTYATGSSITISSDVPNTQGVDLTSGGGFYPDVIEDALDRSVVLVQQLVERNNRSLRAPITDEDALDDLPPAVERASTFLAFDADGQPIASGGSPGGVAVSTFMETVLGSASATAARTAIGLGGPQSVCEARLTVQTGVAVPVTDQTAKTTLYLTGFRGDRIALHTGSAWVMHALGGVDMSIAVPATTNQMYDVFLDYNDGTPALALLAWTNDTTRATALAKQDGVLVKTADTQQRYLGSIRTTGVSGQTEDSLAKRYVWNYYNRVLRHMSVVDATNSWNHTSALRQANGNTANQLDYVLGVEEEPVCAEVVGIAQNSGGTILANVGVGVDSTSSNSAQVRGPNSIGTTAITALVAKYEGFPGIGRHYLAWLEGSAASGTTTWYGDNSAAFIAQSGIQGRLFG